MPTVRLNNGNIVAEGSLTALHITTRDVSTETMSVTGQLTASGDITATNITGDVYVTGTAHATSIQADTFNASHIQGLTTIEGDVQATTIQANEITGLTTINGDVSMTSLTSGTTTVSGEATLGETTITGNADITGNASIDGDVSTNSLTSGTTTVSGNATLGETSITGNATVNGDISASSLTSGTTTISGTATLGETSITGNADINGDATVTGDISASSLTSETTTVSGNATFGAATITGDATINGNVSTNSLTSGATSVSGEATLGETTITGDVTINGGMDTGVKGKAIIPVYSQDIQIIDNIWYSNTDQSVINVAPATWDDTAKTCHLISSIPVTLNGVTWLGGSPEFDSTQSVFEIELNQTSANLITADLKGTPELELIGYYRPSVTNGILSWTASNPDLPFVASATVTGPQGPQGETGPQGPQGEQGPPGVTSTTGEPMINLAEESFVISHACWYVNTELSSITVIPGTWINEVMTCYLKTSVPVTLTGVIWLSGQPTMTSGYTYVIALQQLDATRVIANLAYSVELT